jgi:hypothetical protein
MSKTGLLRRDCRRVEVAEEPRLRWHGYSIVAKTGPQYPVYHHVFPVTRVTKPGFG